MILRTNFNLVLYDYCKILKYLRKETSKNTAYSYRFFRNIAVEIVKYVFWF